MSRDEVSRWLNAEKWRTTFSAEPIRVPEEISPVKILTGKAEDGNIVEASCRVPPGEGPFPAVIFVHGGLVSMGYDYLCFELRANPIHTRFLAAGYITVMTTYRTYIQNTREIGAVLDVLSIVKRVKSMPEADPESICLYGSSGGGAISLEVATRMDLAAIAVGEPAIFVFGGYYTEKDRTDSKEMARPNDIRGRGIFPMFSREELMARYEEKLKKLRCPIIIFGGDINPINKKIEETFIPILEALGSTFVQKIYPGMDHGLCWGRDKQTSLEVVERVIRDATSFFGLYIKTKPKSISITK